MNAPAFTGSWSTARQPRTGHEPLSLVPVRAGHGYRGLFRQRRLGPSVRSGAELPGASRLARPEDPPVFTARVRWPPARRAESCFPWTESPGPRAGLRDHRDAQKRASDLQRYRAAYRNRTDDLRITRGSIPGRAPASCTDSTDHRTDGTRRAGTIQGPVSRPRPCITVSCSLCVTSLRHSHQDSQHAADALSIMPADLPIAARHANSG